jgi:hypothetical protein
MRNRKTKKDMLDRCWSDDLSAQLFELLSTQPWLSSEGSSSTTPETASSRYCPFMLLEKPCGDGFIADHIGDRWISATYRNGRLCCVCVEHIYDETH